MVDVEQRLDMDTCRSPVAASFYFGDLISCYPVSRSKKVAGDMEENRGGKADRVKSIHHAAMTTDHTAPILGTQAALHGRHYQTAQKS